MPDNRRPPEEGEFDETIPPAPEPPSPEGVDDLFAAWNLHAAYQRLYYESHLRHQEAKHKKALQTAQKGSRRLPHYSNWREDPEGRWED